MHTTRIELSQEQIDCVITNYWLDHYVDDLCTLCANSGVIDSTGVKSAAGFPAGRKNFCICPNGQALRRGHENTGG